MSLPRLVEARARRPLAPAPLGEVRPAPALVARSRLGLVVALAGAGLLVQGIGDAVARAGDGGLGLDLFFVGVAVVFASCAWRLVGSTAGRDERLAVALVLGLTLVLSSWLASPLLFDQYDELLHETTLWQLLDLRRLFTFNSVLPVSPWYPGLELATVAVRWCTGLPTAAAELLVVLASRALLVATLFLFGERVLGSGRAGGLVVLVYALSPQFFAFNAAFSYQTIALAFGAAAVYFALRAGDEVSARRRRVSIGLSLAAVAGAVVSHHLTGWLTVGLLVVWAVATTLDARRDPGEAGRAAAVRLVAAAGVLLAAGWTAVTAPTLIPYLSPVFSGAWSSLVGLLHHGRHRQLFHSATGVSTPAWQQALIVLSVLVGVALVVVGVVRFVQRRRAPGRYQHLMAVLVTLGYVAVLASPLEGASFQVGQRGSTFVYLAIAVVSAAWLVKGLRRVPTAVLAALATGVFVGSLVFGSGASWAYVPGPYVPASDQRAIDGPTIAAARWAASHLPVGARIAADRDNSIMMAAVGHLSPVTEAAREINVGLLYFDPHFGAFERSVIRHFDIRYLLVDNRLADGPPYYGVYFEPGVPAPGARNRLTKEELGKFAAVKGLQRIYSNGPIQIYDTAGLLGTRAPATATPPIGRPGTDVHWSVLGPALAVGALWLVLLVRRRRRRRLAVGTGTAVVTGGLAGAIALMFAYVPSGLPPDPLAWAVLAGLAAGAVAFAVRGRAAAPDGTPPSPVLGRLGLALALAGGLAVAAGIGVAVRSDQRAFRVENAVSVSPVGAGPARAEVSLAAGSRQGDHLAVRRHGTVTSVPLAAAAHQEVALPRTATGTGASVALVVHGRTVATVRG